MNILKLRNLFCLSPNLKSLISDNLKLHHYVSLMKRIPYANFKDLSLKTIIEKKFQNDNISEDLLAEINSVFIKQMQNIY